jgi:hypothetical protein
MLPQANVIICRGNLTHKLHETLHAASSTLDFGANRTSGLPSDDTKRAFYTTASDERSVHHDSRHDECSQIWSENSLDLFLGLHGSLPFVTLRLFLSRVLLSHAMSSINVRYPGLRFIYRNATSFQVENLHLSPSHEKPAFFFKRRSRDRQE